jgi:hypothetical protein
MLFYDAENNKTVRAVAILIIKAPHLRESSILHPLNNHKTYGIQ